MFGALISNLEPILRLGQPYYEYQASKDLLHKKLVLDKFRRRYYSMMSLHEPPQAGRWPFTSDVHVQCA